jgi:hypothetical protein
MLRASMRMLGTISTISSSATNSTCSTDTRGPKIGSHFLPVECGREGEGVGYLGGREDGEVRVGLPRHECHEPGWRRDSCGSEAARRERTRARRPDAPRLSKLQPNLRAQKPIQSNNAASVRFGIVAAAAHRHRADGGG